MAIEIAHPPARVKVLIVDDSAPVRLMLGRELGRDPRLSVVGMAADAYAARDLIARLRPDVITLDIQMPRMDGITFLRRLMKYHPIPVVILSSWAGGDAPAAIEALAAGAVDVVAKPGPGQAMEKLFPVLADKLAVAAASNLRVHGAGRCSAPRRTGGYREDTIFALGASTGGVQALTHVLGGIAADAPATVIVQHMPRGFTASFAHRLNHLSALDVKEAADGDDLMAGRALVAPGDRHMTICREGGRWRLRLGDEAEVNHQRPSVDVLFESIARCAGGSAVAALLTGMGTDGARGLLRLRQAGARTIAEAESTCTVFGMPAEAIRQGAAEKVVPLHQIAATMMAMARQSKEQAIAS